MKNLYSVMLSEDQIDLLADAAYRRTKQLQKSIDRDTGTYYNALEQKCKELRQLQDATGVLRQTSRALNEARIKTLKEKLNA